MPAHIAFSEVTGDQAEDRGVVAYDKIEDARAVFGQIQRMKLDDDVNGTWIVDLLKENDDILDTIVVKDHHAGFLIDTFFGRASTGE